MFEQGFCYDLTHNREPITIQQKESIQSDINENIVSGLLYKGMYIIVYVWIVYNVVIVFVEAVINKGCDK